MVGRLPGILAVATGGETTGWGGDVVLVCLTSSVGHVDTASAVRCGMYCIFKIGIWINFVMA